MQLDADLEHAIEAYNEANARLEETEKRIAENTTRLKITRNNLQVAQEELNQALVNAYMHGETDIVQVMLSADSLSAVLDEVSLLNRATSHSADVLGAHPPVQGRGQGAAGRPRARRRRRGSRRSPTARRAGTPSSRGSRPARRG